MDCDRKNQAVRPCRQWVDDTVDWCIVSLRLASCLIYALALIEYITRLVIDRMPAFFFTILRSMKFAKEKVLVFIIIREKCCSSATLSLTVISRADWSDKSEWYCRTGALWSNKSGSKKMHPNEQRNGYRLPTKWVQAVTNHLSSRGLVQPVNVVVVVCGRVVCRKGLCVS